MSQGQSEGRGQADGGEGEHEGKGKGQEQEAEEYEPKAKAGSNQDQRGAEQRDERLDAAEEDQTEDRRAPLLKSPVQTTAHYQWRRHGNNQAEMRCDLQVCGVMHLQLRHPDVQCLWDTLLGNFAAPPMTSPAASEVGIEPALPAPAMMILVAVRLPRMCVDALLPEDLATTVSGPSRAYTSSSKKDTRPGAAGSEAGSGLGYGTGAEAEDSDVVVASLRAKEVEYEWGRSGEGAVRSMISLQAVDVVDARLQPEASVDVTGSMNGGDGRASSTSLTAEEARHMKRLDSDEFMPRQKSTSASDPSNSSGVGVEEDPLRTPTPTTTQAAGNTHQGRLGPIGIHAPVHKNTWTHRNPRARVQK